MSAPTTEHKSITCVYNEHTDTWSATVKDSEVTANKLPLLRTKIDRILKGGFKRVPAILYEGGWRDKGFTPCVVTSVDHGPHYRNAWILQGKSRSKVSLNALYAVTPANQKLVDQVTAWKKEKEALEARIEAAVEKMVGIDTEKVDS